MSYMYQKTLIGKTIKDVWISNEGDYLVFDFDGYAPYYFYVESECCSSTWIHEINGRDALRDAEINSVESKDIELPDDKNDKDNEDSLESYCLTLTTRKGRCDIIYRNQSNGYYGGDLTYLDWESDQYGLEDHEHIKEEFKDKSNFKKVENDQMTIV